MSLRVHGSRKRGATGGGGCSVNSGEDDHREAATTANSTGIEFESAEVGITTISSVVGSFNAHGDVVEGDREEKVAPPDTEETRKASVATDGEDESSLLSNHHGDKSLLPVPAPPPPVVGEAALLVEDLPSSTTVHKLTVLSSTSSLGNECIICNEFQADHAFIPCG